VVRWGGFVRVMMRRSFAQVTIRRQRRKPNACQRRKPNALGVDNVCEILILRFSVPGDTGRVGGVAEWLKAADCKSARVCVRWFESSPLHHHLCYHGSAVSIRIVGATDSVPLGLVGRV
jgi:hypothetical protein